MPYRRSIWEFNDEYAPSPKDAGDVDLQLIATLQSIEAAKKRTPPIPIARLPELAEKLKSAPDPEMVDPHGFAAYLNEICVYGVGIKTAVCMLAVVSKGAFPPMDQKLAAGLHKLGHITESVAEALNSGKVEDFAAVYVGKIIPLWRDARSQGEEPRAIDDRWSGAGD